jgi:hypothetical protein
MPFAVSHRDRGFLPDFGSSVLAARPGRTVGIDLSDAPSGRLEFSSILLKTIQLVH